MSSPCAASELRTVQFQIERPPVKGIFYLGLPLDVWVYWPPVQRGTYACNGTCQQIYRVTEESSRKVMAAQWRRWRKGSVYYVCGCMGQVIE